LVEIFVVTTPGKDFAVGCEDDAGDVVDGTGGAMVAGNPLGRGERDGAGSDGDVDFGVVELTWGVGEVGGDLDGGFLGLQKGGCGEKKSDGQKGLAGDHERGVPLVVRGEIF
jgi:hypothetical protein